MVASVLWTVIFSAIVVETIVNIIRNVGDVVNSEEDGPGKFYWIALGTSLVGGLIVSINYDVDLFKLAGMEGKVPVIGAILTGLIVSRGSNVVSDVVDRLNSWRK